MPTIHERMATVEARLENMGILLEHLSKSLTRIESRLTAIETRLDHGLSPGDAPACVRHEARIRAVEEAGQTIADQAAVFSSRLSDLDKLIERAKGAWWVIGLAGGALGAASMSAFGWILTLIKP